MTRAHFDWQDPFAFSAMLTEEERMIRDSAHQYCQNKLMPRVLMANREEHFHREIMNELGELGLLGATLPEKYGCSAVNYVCYGVPILRRVPIAMILSLRLLRQYLKFGNAAWQLLGSRLLL